MIRFKTFLAEGGAFGHLSHPHDIDEFTFGDLETIVTDALSGKLESAREKNDGQNLLISWIDGKFRAARNKSHIKNFGRNSLSVSATKSMFAGRGTIEKAFSSAVDDLSNAISTLTTKQKEKVFANGHKFMSVEVQHSANPNVVHYGNDLIVTQGTLEYNEAGDAISQLNIEDGRILSGMLKQVRSNSQSTFEIKSVEKLMLSPSPNFSQLRTKYTTALKKIRSKYGLKLSSSMYEYKEAFWRAQLKRQIPQLERELEQVLVDRFAHYIKKPSIVQIVKQSQYGKEIQTLNKKHQELSKLAIQPIEDVFLQMGANVISGMSQFVAVNPKYSSTVMKKNLDAAVAKIRSSGNEAAIDKLRKELDRLDRIGIGQIAPTEGITFFYRGELLKITGKFAALNQISSLLWKL